MEAEAVEWERGGAAAMDLLRHLGGNNGGVEFQMGFGREECSSHLELTLGLSLGRNAAVVSKLLGESEPAAAAITSSSLSKIERDFMATGQVSSDNLHVEKAKRKRITDQSGLMVSEYCSSSSSPYDVSLARKKMEPGNIGSAEFSGFYRCGAAAAVASSSLPVEVGGVRRLVKRDRTSEAWSSSFGSVGSRSSAMDFVGRAFPGLGRNTALEFLKTWPETTIVQKSRDAAAMTASQEVSFSDWYEAHHRPSKRVAAGKIYYVAGAGAGRAEKPSSMPRVSTAGVGLNGKKIEGFLYRYGKGEDVRIVCACHRSFLTPAEFVQHAGGDSADVAQPLRHIIVDSTTAGP